MNVFLDFIHPVRRRKEKEEKEKHERAVAIQSQIVAQANADYNAALALSAAAAAAGPSSSLHWATNSSYLNNSNLYVNGGYESPYEHSGCVHNPIHALFSAPLNRSDSKSGNRSGGSRSGSVLVKRRFRDANKKIHVVECPVGKAGGREDEAHRRGLYNSEKGVQCKDKKHRWRFGRSVFSKNRQKFSDGYTSGGGGWTDGGSYRGSVVHGGSGYASCGEAYCNCNYANYSSGYASGVPLPKNNKNHCRSIKIRDSLAFHHPNHATTTDNAVPSNSNTVKKALAGPLKSTSVLQLSNSKTDRSCSNIDLNLSPHKNVTNCNFHSHNVTSKPSSKIKNDGTVCESKINRSLAVDSGARSRRERESVRSLGSRPSYGSTGFPGMFGRTKSRTLVFPFRRERGSFLGTFRLRFDPGLLKANEERIRREMNILYVLNSEYRIHTINYSIHILLLLAHLQ